MGQSSSQIQPTQDSDNIVGTNTLTTTDLGVDSGQQAAEEEEAFVAKGDSESSSADDLESIVGVTISLDQSALRSLQRADDDHPSMPTSLTHSNPDDAVGAIPETDRSQQSDEEGSLSSYSAQATESPPAATPLRDSIANISTPFSSLYSRFFKSPNMAGKERVEQKRKRSPEEVEHNAKKMKRAHREASPVARAKKVETQDVPDKELEGHVEFDDPGSAVLSELKKAKAERKAAKKKRKAEKAAAKAASQAEGGDEDNIEVKQVSPEPTKKKKKEKKKITGVVEKINDSVDVRTTAHGDANGDANGDVDMADVLAYAKDNAHKPLDSQTSVEIPATQPEELIEQPKKRRKKNEQQVVDANGAEVTTADVADAEAAAKTKSKPSRNAETRAPGADETAVLGPQTPANLSGEPQATEKIKPTQQKPVQPRPKKGKTVSAWLSGHQTPAVGPDEATPDRAPKTVDRRNYDNVPSPESPGDDILPRNRLPTVLDGPSKGAFTEMEKKIADAILESCCIADGEEKDVLKQRVSTDWTNAGPFKQELLAALPNRGIMALRKFCARRYSLAERGVWRDEEDKELMRQYKLNPDKWKAISEAVGRTGQACRDRYRCHLKDKDTMQSGAWSLEEEQKFMEIVEELIEKIKASPKDEDYLTDDREKLEAGISWDVVSEKMGRTRTAKRCREKFGKLKKRAPVDASQSIRAPPATMGAYAAKMSKQVEAKFETFKTGDVYDALTEIYTSVSDMDATFAVETTFWSLVSEKNPESRFTSLLRRRAYEYGLKTWRTNRIGQARTIAAKAQAVVQKMDRLVENRELKLIRGYVGGPKKPRTPRVSNQSVTSSKKTSKSKSKEYISDSGDNSDDSDNEEEAKNDDAEDQVNETPTEAEEEEAASQLGSHHSQAERGDGNESDHPYSALKNLLSSQSTGQSKDTTLAQALVKNSQSENDENLQAEVEHAKRKTDGSGKLKRIKTKPGFK